MRGNLGFWWQCVRLAARGTVAFANDWQWLFGLPLGMALLGLLASAGGPLMTGSPAVDALFAGAVAFVITWFVIFFVRLLAAPAVLYRQAQRQADIDLTQVPYCGGTLMVHDMLAGRVDVSLTSLLDDAPYIQDGRLKLLGIVSDRRVPQFPDTPALAEVLTGLLQADAWTGIAAAPLTPMPITDKLCEATAQVLQMPDVRERSVARQAEPVGNTPEDIRTMIRTIRIGGCIRAAGISLD